MNQGIDAGTAILLTVICTLFYVGVIAYRKWKDKGENPGEITYWQNGEKHTVKPGFIKKEKHSRKGK